MAEDFSPFLQLLQELVRIPSTSHLGPSSGSYAACVALLDKECKERGFKVSGRVYLPEAGADRRGDRRKPTS